MKKLMVALFVVVTLVAVVSVIYIVWQPASVHSSPAGTETVYTNEAEIPPSTTTITKSPEPIVTLTPEPDVFTSTDIPEDVQALMLGKTIYEDSIVQFEDLRYLTLTHWGYDGQKHTGYMIVNYQIADDVLQIFKVLLENKYPIEKIILPDYYDGNDELSMRDNNTSAFNDRPIEGSGALSWHQLGLAIDINPLYNPYIHLASNKIEPSTAGEYLDRTLRLQGMIMDDDICVTVFKEYGFTWGGDWVTVKDYQHFEKAIN